MHLEELVESDAAPRAANRPDAIAATRKPRLGFLGVGWIGRQRMETLLESGVAEVVAVSDPSPEMLDAALGVAPNAKVARSLNELLDLALDGVVIATPSALHAGQSLAALNAGLAVFCQKPLGRTAEEVRSVVRAAERANRLLGVDLSYRATASFRRLREVVRSGGIGRVYTAELVFHNAYGPDKSWFFDPRLSGGGCVMDLGVHLVDCALWVLDFPAVENLESRLFSRGRPLEAGHGVEDHAIARIDLAGGTAIQLACSWNLSVGQDAVISATFHGTEGGCAVRNVGGSFYDFVTEHYRGTRRETLVEPPDAWSGRAAVEWAARLAAGEGFDPAAGEYTRVAEVLDRIYGR